MRRSVCRATRVLRVARESDGGRSEVWLAHPGRVSEYHRVGAAVLGLLALCVVSARIRAPPSRRFRTQSILHLGVSRRCAESPAEREDAVKAESPPLAHALLPRARLSTTPKRAPRVDTLGAADDRCSVLYMQPLVDGLHPALERVGIAVREDRPGAVGEQILERCDAARIDRRVRAQPGREREHQRAFRYGTGLSSTKG